MLCPARLVMKKFNNGSVRNGTNISVILMESLDKKGNAGEIIEVKRGFARNLLIPRKIAVYATTENKIKFARSDLSLKETKQQLNNMLAAGEIVTIHRAANAKGQLYDPLNVGDLENHIRLTQGKRPRNIFLPTPIKKLGRHTALINENIEIYVDVLPSTTVV